MALAPAESWLRPTATRPSSEVAGVGDARVGEHALEVALRQGEHVADDHGEHGEHDQHVGPALRRRDAARSATRRRKPAKAPALMPTDMKAVTGVGAPS